MYHPNDVSIAKAIRIRRMQNNYMSFDWLLLDIAQSSLFCEFAKRAGLPSQV